MQVTILGSGSGGNCTYVATENTGILVDLGFGWRSLNRRMGQADQQGARIDALLLTHGHSDHVRGALPFLSRHPVPVFMNRGTRKEVSQLGSVPCCEEFSTTSTFSIGDIEVEPFAVSHDAEEPVGFRFSAGGVAGALVTDLGELSGPVIGKLAGCDWLVLESNHDEEMLKLGSYPWHIKQRVLSKVGHLSNQAVSSFLVDHFDGRAAHIFLAHLSKQNNDPQIALRAASAALSQRLRLFRGTCQLHLTHQDKPSVVLDL